MAAKAKLSVLGLYQWDHNIFSDMAIPEEVDGEILTWKILEDCAELEILYSDPDYMKASLYNWSSAMLPSWTKIQEALTAEYNPIWNKDGTIKEKRTYGQQQESRNYGQTQETRNYGQTQETRNYGQTQETMLYGADTTTTTIGPRSTETTHQVSGFNESTLNNATKDSASSLQATDTQARQSHTDTVTGGAHNDTVTGSAHNDTVTGSAHNDTATKQSYIDQVEITEQGNIGVTESSAMVRHEVELRQDFNIYSIITRDFKKHYCLQIY